jgi:hypothetical protein
MRPHKKSTLSLRPLVLCGALLLATAGLAVADGTDTPGMVVLDPIPLGDTPDGSTAPEPVDPGGTTDPTTGGGDDPRPGDHGGGVILQPPVLGLTGGPGPIAYSWANDAWSPRYNPMALYSRVPGKGGVQAGRRAAGDYHVSLSGFQPARGKGSNVQVTAYGGGSTRCKVNNWNHGASNDTLNARVRCYDSAGRPADAQFALLATGAFTGGGRGGYVWADQPTAANYKPNDTYAYNSTGGPIEIARGGTGEYKMVFDGLGGKRGGGNLQVTAHGASNTHCNIDDWSSQGKDFVAVVRCYDPNGRPADSTFSALVTWQTRGNPRAGYAWANQPTAASYSPMGLYAFNSGGKAPTVKRARPGSYAVTFPGLGGGKRAGANVQVTAYGTSGACKVRNWNAGGSDLLLNVDCHDAAGRPADTRFSTLVLW